jgi:hypothetical protein
VFDTSSPDDVAPARHEVIGELRRRVAAVTGEGPSTVSSLSSSLPPADSSLPVAGSGTFPVPAPLAAVLPRRGLARGSVVSLQGQGASSLLFALLSGPPASWSALVGMPDIGMLAASEFGVDLDRVVLVPEPGPDVLQVLSILVDGVDMVAVTLPPRARPGPGRLRVITGRLRQCGAVLLSVGPWPGADLVLTSRWQGWAGLGQGHGRLRERELVVDVSGRGAAAGRPRQAALLLRSQRTAVQLAQGSIRAATETHGFDPGLLQAAAEVG